MWNKWEFLRIGQLRINQLMDNCGWFPTLISPDRRDIGLNFCSDQTVDFNLLHIDVYHRRLVGGRSNLRLYCAVFKSGRFTHDIR